MTGHCPEWLLRHRGTGLAPRSAVSSLGLIHHESLLLQGATAMADGWQLVDVAPRQPRAGRVLLHEVGTLSAIHDRDEEIS